MHTYAYMFFTRVQRATFEFETIVGSGTCDSLHVCQNEVSKTINAIPSKLWKGIRKVDGLSCGCQAEFNDWCGICGLGSRAHTLIHRTHRPQTYIYHHHHQPTSPPPSHSLTHTLAHVYTTTTTHSYFAFTCHDTQTWMESQSSIPMKILFCYYSNIKIIQIHKNKKQIHPRGRKVLMHFPPHWSFYENENL